MKKHLLILSAIIIFTTVFTSCTNNDNEKNSRISIRLVDNPGDFDKVYVDVQDVLVKKEGEGWESIGNVDAQIYDLLTLTGGIDALLVDSEIPSGMLNQIRLVLGDQNSIVIDGITFPLNTPSAQQSGLKLSVNTELVAGVAYNFILDFDVDRSIAIVAGNSANINLHPVIRVITEAESGAISGDVSPFDYQV